MSPKLKAVIDDQVFLSPEGEEVCEPLADNDNKTYEDFLEDEE